MNSLKAKRDKEPKIVSLMNYWIMMEEKRTTKNMKLICGEKNKHKVYEMRIFLFD